MRILAGRAQTLPGTRCLPLDPTPSTPHTAPHSWGSQQWSLGGSRRARGQHFISQRQAGGTTCEQRLQAPGTRSIVPSLLTKHKFKDKICKNSKMLGASFCVWGCVRGPRRRAHETHSRLKPEENVLPLRI